MFYQRVVKTAAPISALVRTLARVTIIREQYMEGNIIIVNDPAERR